MNNFARSLMVASVLCSVSAILPNKIAAAQEGDIPPVSSERPSVGSSADLVPRGSLQVENGVNLVVQRDNYTADLPESFIRYGLSRHVEVRLLSSNMDYRSSAAPSDPLFETQDLGVSAKLGIAINHALVPKTAIVNLGIPTGGTHMTTGSYDPALTLVWAQSSHGFTVLEQAQGTLTSFQGARRPLWVSSISAGHAVNPTVSFFLEYAPSVLPDDSLTYVVDGGFTITRSGLRQFDVRTGYLKDGHGVHTLISLGYTIRRDNFLRRSRRF